MFLLLFFSFFFFSSRRRHTRSLRDWSSDVCSSDLVLVDLFDGGQHVLLHDVDKGLVALDGLDVQSHAGREHRVIADEVPFVQAANRSEERRVGKEGRTRWRTAHGSNKVKKHG